MEKLDILDLLVADAVYDKFVEGKFNTAYIDMEKCSVDSRKLDKNVLPTNELQTEFLIETGLIVVDSDKLGIPTDDYKMIIYTVVDGKIFICAACAQYIMLRYITDNGGHGTLIINCEFDEDLYFRYYTLVLIIKDFYLLD